MKTYISFKDSTDSPDLNELKLIHLSSQDYEADTIIKGIKEDLRESRKLYAPFLEKTPKKKKLHRK